MTRVDAVTNALQVNPITGKRMPISEAYELASEKTKERVQEAGYNGFEALAMVPELVTIKSAMQRARGNLFPPNPLTLSSLVVHHDFKTTLAGELFCQTSDVASANKMLVFASDDFLVKLASSDEIWMDGTFYACPSLFKQLYTIHALVNNQMFCMVYALLPGFSADVYKDLFRFLQDRIYNIAQEKQLDIAFSPSRATLDFEASAISALKTVFPNASISGCFFHFCQCLWKNMQKKDLQIRYSHPVRRELPLRRMFRRLCSLSLMPASEVSSLHQTITLEAMARYHDDNDVCAFLSYFESTWMGRIPEWNHYRNFGPRTNNHLEAFHGSLKKTLKNEAHPNLYPFINLIRHSQRKYEKKFMNMAAGRRPDQIKKQVP